MTAPRSPSADQLCRRARDGAQAIEAGRFAAPGLPLVLRALADLAEAQDTDLAVTRVERDAALAEVRRLKSALKDIEASQWREHEQ